jgi:hypothetical protein
MSITNLIYSQAGQPNAQHYLVEISENILEHFYRISVRPLGIEPRTYGLRVRRSNQLS